MNRYDVSNLIKSQKYGFGTFKFYGFRFARIRWWPSSTAHSSNEQTSSTARWNQSFSKKPFHFKTNQKQKSRCTNQLKRNDKKVKLRTRSIL